MAQKRIEAQDLINPKALESIINDAKKLEAELSKILATNKQLLKNNPFKTGKDIKKFQEQTSAAKATEQALVKVRKDRVRVEGQLAALRTRQADELTEVNELKKEQARINRLEAQANTKALGAYKNLSARLNILRRRYKDVATSQGVNSKEARKLAAEVNKLDARLKKVDGSVGQFQRNVGNYTSAFSRMGASIRTTLGAFGLTSGIFLFANGIKNAARTVADFEKSNAELAGVLNTTLDGVSTLQKEAERLGSITAKSASEVTKLQIAYARLGFSQEEIINLTEGTINGSIALNAELDQTAELTGAVIRTFDDLETQDAGKVLDVLTVATQKSALNFEKLQTALPIVSGAANAAGIGLNRLVALLGKLSDAGIDASSSSTALRNIFIESAKQGLSYEDIIKKIANSTDKLTAANDEFGKRAAVSASIVANNINQVGSLEEALNKAGGTAEKVATVQLDTLNGQLKLLDSAWEGFILGLESGDGVISKVVRGAIKLTTDLLTNLKDLSKTAEDVAQDSAGKIQKEINLLIEGEQRRFKQVRILREEISKIQYQQSQLEQAKPTILDAILNPGQSMVKGNALKVEQEKLNVRLELLRKTIANLTKEAADESAGLDENTKTINKNTDAVDKNNESKKKAIDFKKDDIDLLYIEKGITDKQSEIEAKREQERIARNDERFIAQNKLVEQIEGEEKLREANEEADKRRKKEAQERAIETANVISNSLITAYARVDQARLQQAASDVESQKERVATQQRLAERGLANTLAFEEEKAARLEAKREELAKKAERRQKTLAYLTAFTEFLKQDPNSAAGKALAQVALAETISGAFYEGTENVADSIGSPIFSGRDGYVIRVDGQERVMTGMQNKKIGGLTNDQLADLAQAYNRGDVISKGGPGLSDRGLKRIEDAVKSINIHVDAEGFITREEFERGMKKITKTKPRRL